MIEYERMHDIVSGPGSGPVARVYRYRAPCRTGTEYERMHDIVSGPGSGPVARFTGITHQDWCRS